MTETNQEKKNTPVEKSASVLAPNVRAERGRGGDRKPHERQRFSRKRRQPGREARSEFVQKVIGIRRVTRVVAGGRRFGFSVAMVLGDKNGSVGLGVGKALDTALAIEKAVRDGKRNMIKVKRTSSLSIPHEVHAKFSSSRVFMAPAPGRGLIAGSSVRSVLELAGITDVGAKILSRSKNKINNAKVAIEALKQFV